jgi:hypothetical protein
MDENNSQLVYIQAAPLILSKYHTREKNPVSILQSLLTISTSRDNVRYYFFVLLCRLRSCRLLGEPTILSSKLLGVKMLNDYTVQVPKADIDIIVSGTQVTRDNFEITRESAYINANGAQFAFGEQQIMDSPHSRETISEDQVDSTERRTNWRIFD